MACLDLNEYSFILYDSSFVLLQSSLLFCMFHNLLFNRKPLSLAYRIHVPPSDILGVCLLSKMQQLFFSGGHPERVTGY